LASLYCRSQQEELNLLDITAIVHHCNLNGQKKCDKTVKYTHTHKKRVLSEKQMDRQMSDSIRQLSVTVGQTKQLERMIATTGQLK
jgi:D-alanine-D-alanine ligase-like ATP-grasp enzyme